MAKRNSKFRMRNFLPLALAMSMLPPSPIAQAASEDECSIWLCLPTGFGEGCGGAKSAFKHRVKRGKPPLPDLGECVLQGKTGVPDVDDAIIGGESTFSYQDGIAASFNNKPPLKGTPCIRYNSGYASNPKGCTGTLRYVEIFMDGTTFGDPYFW